ncbi:hypothetical protein CWI39_2164p0020 [Hamiltosporidium magnivora]|uniref:Uncharacterized protein n=1 Tax=Hamiltosporidium magnivora TaxID=148818 RepID=A0A4Q9KVZ3_9MICR|nr:hypothetical protein CWI39_2164p0020 [Hamiltosporidium magnivora]
MFNGKSKEQSLYSTVNLIKNIFKNLKRNTPLMHVCEICNTEFVCYDGVYVCQSGHTQALTQEVNEEVLAISRNAFSSKHIKETNDYVLEGKPPIYKKLLAFIISYKELKKCLQFESDTYLKIYLKMCNFDPAMSRKCTLTFRFSYLVDVLYYSKRVHEEKKGKTFFYSSFRKFIDKIPFQIFLEQIEKEYRISLKDDTYVLITGRDVRSAKNCHIFVKYLGNARYPYKYMYDHKVDKFLLKPKEEIERIKKRNKIIKSIIRRNKRRKNKIPLNEKLKILSIPKRKLDSDLRHREIFRKGIRRDFEMQNTYFNEISRIFGIEVTEDLNIQYHKFYSMLDHRYIVFIPEFEICGFLYVYLSHKKISFNEKAAIENLKKRGLLNDLNPESYLNSLKIKGYFASDKSLVEFAEKPVEKEIKDCELDDEDIYENLKTLMCSFLFLSKRIFDHFCSKVITLINNSYSRAANRRFWRSYYRSSLVKRSYDMFVHSLTL